GQAGEPVARRSGHRPALNDVAGRRGKHGRRRGWTLRRRSYRRRCGAVLLVALAVTSVSGCGALRDFRGANSLPMPGRLGVGAGHYTIQAQMPDVQNLKPNSRVEFNDVLIGNVANVERQGWHALVTMTIEPNVDLPANATAAVGQTSLLGTLHVEL